MVKPGGYRMKWVNKGHEFDALGAVFQKNNKLFLVGTAEDNEALCTKLDFLGIAIETSSLPKGRNSKLSELFYLLLNLLPSPLFGRISRIAGRRNCESDKSGKTVIINHPNIFYAEYILQQFTMIGKYIKNENIFLVNDFMEKYLSVFAIYVCGKVYLYNIGIIVTTLCNLNCKYCLNFTPYNRNMKHRPLEELKNELDILFPCVDRLANLSISGGETMLYPNVGDLLQYISDRYRNKIDNIGIGTNGTTIPSDELCMILRKSKVTVYADNYSKSIPRLKIPYKKFIEKLVKYGIEHKQIYIKQFYKTFPPLKNYSLYDDLRLSDRFDKCIQVHYQDQKNGRIAACCYAAYALEAGLIDESEDDYYEINNFPHSIQSKKELVEFRLGYTNKGYVEFCKYCNGFPAINSHIAKNGAEQVKGKLAWDNNNPFASCQ
jgi:MoaA/NifB/PqqE/SkfB family radical SAM enzyme